MSDSPVNNYNNFSGGIADFPKEGIPNSFAFAQSIDVRTDPQNITVLPRTIKESGNIVIDLVKWAETFTSNLTTYLYGDIGNLYSRSSAGSYSLLRMIGNSHGNGLLYSQEDDYLYYPGDKVIGRYGPLSSASPTFTDDFLGSLGGVPLNTNSLDLESSSSQYASRADTTSLSITGNISFDVQIKPESLPTAASQMVLVSKWDESGATRSYKFDINTASGFFGDGSDGNLTISVDTTDSPIDSVCGGTNGTNTLTATNASFSTGQIILIHQSRGTGAGAWQRNTIQSYVAGTITLVDALNSDYFSFGTNSISAADQAQVLVLKQYNNVTINNGVTLTVKAWNGSVGGIIAFIASGTLTISGTMTASGATGASTAVTSNAQTAVTTGGGFRGGYGFITNNPSNNQGQSGEGNSNQALTQRTANGSGGGGGLTGGGSNGGGGGGNRVGGSNGHNNSFGGGISGAADLTTITFGGGGGGGVRYSSSGGSAGAGGSGGGIIFLTAATLVVTGSIRADGGRGGATSSGAGNGGAGGGGAGGSILLKAQTATLGSGLISADEALGGDSMGANANGGTGGSGYAVLDYYTSYSGSTSPTLNPIQDNSLVTNTSQQLRLSISSTGSNSEVLAQVANIQIGTWQQVGVTWNSSTKVATFYLNAVPIGTRTGSLASINDNASTFQVGMSKSGAGAAEKFYDGLIDEVRLFNVVRSDNDMTYGMNQQISVNTTGLVAYYKFNGDYADATANTNILTATNSPVFSSDVPFPSPTTRLDIDQSRTAVGNTYAVPTSISESTTNRLTFTPQHDPQKSIQFNVSNIGTGTWTVTIHDTLNNVIATSTVLNANMHTGNYEFIFSSVWSPLTNFTNAYHAHITCASGSPTVVTSSSNDLETADFVTYYQFLVNDTEWHPMARLLNFWIIGNGRYIGKYEAPLYEPNEIVLQAGFRVRCFADWREYKAIGVMKGDNIQDFDQGRIYFWDGYSPTFNFYIDVPEGGVNAMLGSRGRLFIWAGYKNQLLVYEGGDTAQKLKDMPNIEEGSYSEIYPQGVCMWRSLLRYGVAGNGNSTELQKGVYTYGSTNLRYPEILTYDYPISTGNTSNTGLKIGMTTVVNQQLLISWKDGTGYGIDYVSEDNPPFTSSYIDFLITDSNALWKEKNALEMVAYTTPLLTGESISLAYDLESSNIFTSNSDSVSVGDTLSRMLLTNERYHEMQVRLSISCLTTAPTIKNIVLAANVNETEGRY